MPWYEIVLSDEQVAAQVPEAMREEFILRLTACGVASGVLPIGAAIAVSRADSKRYYFTPDAAAFSMDLMRRYDGAECPAPRESDVAAFAGNCWPEGIPFASE
jgi:hypothetical protein